MTGAASGYHLHFQVINCYSRVGVKAYIQGTIPRTGQWPLSVNTRA